MSRSTTAEPMTTEHVLAHLREIMFRASPLSDREREAIVLFNAQLKKHLDFAEDALERTGATTDSIKSLRYLLEAVPGFMV